MMLPLPRPPGSWSGILTRLLSWPALVLAAGVSLAGCRHVQPVKAWQRANLAKRAMKFDDSLEGRFKQHMFGAREGAEGGYGDVGGGCGCN